MPHHLFAFISPPANTLISTIKGFGGVFLHQVHQMLNEEEMRKEEEARKKKQEEIRKRVEEANRQEQAQRTQEDNEQKKKIEEMKRQLLEKRKKLEEDRNRMQAVRMLASLLLDCISSQNQKPNENGGVVVSHAFRISFSRCWRPRERSKLLPLLRLLLLFLPLPLTVHLFQMMNLHNLNLLKFLLLLPQSLQRLHWLLLLLLQRRLCHPHG
jgi:flagellar biosynthesis GTPase FlhF